jgi:hypothetical protein
MIFIFLSWLSLHISGKSPRPVDSFVDSFNAFVMIRLLIEHLSLYSVWLDFAVIRFSHTNCFQPVILYKRPPCFASDCSQIDRMNAEIRYQYIYYSRSSVYVTFFVIVFVGSRMQISCLCRTRESRVQLAMGEYWRCDVYGDFLQC